MAFNCPQYMRPIIPTRFQFLNVTVIFASRLFGLVFPTWLCFMRIMFVEKQCLICLPRIWIFSVSRRNIAINWSTWTWLNSSAMTRLSSIDVMSSVVTTDFSL